MTKKQNPIKKLDFLGEEPSLTYNGKARYQTFLGAFLSTTSIIVILLSIWKSWKDFKDPDSVEISTSTVFENEYPRMNLTENYFYPTISFQIAETTTPLSAVQVSRYFTVTGHLRTSNFNVDPLSGVSGTVDISHRFNFVPCSTVTSKFKSMLENTDQDATNFLNFGNLCPEAPDSVLDELYVEGNP
jgi:hypothetical protein